MTAADAEETLTVAEQGEVVKEKRRVETTAASSTSEVPATSQQISKIPLTFFAPVKSPSDSIKKGIIQTHFPKKKQTNSTVI